MFGLLQRGRSQPGVRKVIAGELLVQASLRSVGHSTPRLAMCTPFCPSKASMKRMAGSMPTGSLKIFGLVIRRRTLATAIGINVSAAPLRAAAKACASQTLDTAW